ncbi:MAG TPA: hypothetical protein VJ738_01880 [Steroidobacteraceae bacterium]|nr:hypothetical protein [Steroidobacteraceae bacterium]
MASTKTRYTPARWNALVARYYFNGPVPLTPKQARRARELLCAWREAHHEWMRTHRTERG